MVISDLLDRLNEYRTITNGCVPLINQPKHNGAFRVKYLRLYTGFKHARETRKTWKEGRQCNDREESRSAVYTAYQLCKIRGV